MVPRNKRNQRGQALVLTTLLLVPIVGLLALVVDIGLVYLTKEYAQTAAQSAALAAAQAAIDSRGPAGMFTCGSSGLGCQSATACLATAPSSLTSNLQNGCLFAQANGFVQGGFNGQTVSIEANTGNPPTVSGLASGFSRYYATVRITQQNPLTFGRIFGGSLLPVAARATASVASLLPLNCVTTLNPSVSNAFSLSGGSSVVLNNCSL